MNRNGYYIVIDGVDGTGKSTQTQRVKDYIDSLGFPVIQTFEPGGTDFGKKLRNLVLDKKNTMLPETELLLFCADRCEQQHKVKTLLDKGITVISDRFLPSTFAYQINGRGCDKELLEAVVSRTVTRFPNLTIILDIDVETALSRARTRLKHEGKQTVEGRFEAEQNEFFNNVREGFLEYARSDKYGKCVVVKAYGTEDEVFAMIKEELIKWMENERA